jgi:quercetin dioxygenase-like cupin family protein
MIHSANWNDLKIKVLREGVSRKAFTGEGATLAINYFQPGHSTMPHSHKYEQIAMILEGEAEFYIGDEVVKLSEGGVVVIPPDVEHYLKLVGDKDVVNLDVFTPKRPEYVED